MLRSQIDPFIAESVKVLSPKCRELNSASLHRLKESINSLTPFVGAGLSKPFGFPTWQELIEKLASAARISSDVQPLLEKGQLEEAAEILADHHGTFLDDQLEEAFDDQKVPRPITTGAVHLLPKLFRGVVITTNFDRVLEMAYSDAGESFSNARVFPGTRIEQASAAVHAGRHCLLKLHGDYEDPNSRILTLSEYQRQYGSADPNEIDGNLNVPSVLSQALAAGPLLFLGCSLKTDRTLAVIKKLALRLPRASHYALLSETEATRSRLEQFSEWRIRPLFYKDRSAIEAFLRLLADARQAQRASHEEATRVDNPREEKVRINGLKLFYFRRRMKIGRELFAKRLGISKQSLTHLEFVKLKKRPLNELCFNTCSKELLERIENELGCKGELTAGSNDDFRGDYLSFKESFRKTPLLRDRDEEQIEIRFAAKAVVFDFDGTLTWPDFETTWEKIWVALGYSINDCAGYHYDYVSGKITHDTWCRLTMDKFAARGFTKSTLDAVADQIKLMPGVQETFETLERQGIRIYIVSGSIKHIIKRVIGDLWFMVEEIRANDMDFDRNGRLKQILGTKYDFKGKMAYLKGLMAERHLKPTEVLFVGNSCNDLAAIGSGARTLCVNPHGITPDVKHWTYLIKQMKDMREILQFLSEESAAIDPSGAAKPQDSLSTEPSGSQNGKIV